MQGNIVCNGQRVGGGGGENYIKYVYLFRMCEFFGNSVAKRNFLIGSFFSCDMMV